MFKSRCEPTARAMIDTETDAHTAWKLEKFNPRGSGILNSTFRKLEGITLAGCDNDPQAYADKFNLVLQELNTLTKKSQFSDTYKIYRFHLGLGSVYNSYCEQYDQNHDAFDDNGESKFTLEYAITRFLNTAANPTSFNATSSVETQALAALIKGTFAHTPQSVNALIAAGGAAEHKIQAGAHAGNSRIYTQTVKYCSHCKKDWHDVSECVTLHPHLKSSGTNNNSGTRGRGGRDGRGGRGGWGGQRWQGRE